jgi:preprotein translocase subunit SecB
MARGTNIRLRKPTDISAKVALAVQYAVPDISAFDDPGVAQMFGERVVMPASYPFARSKLFDLTADTGVPPILLDLIDLNRRAPVPIPPTPRAAED